MTSPLPLPPAAAANPLMWSRCRWVATTACNLPPLRARMSSAMRAIVFWGAEAGSAVLPKSMRTWRWSAPA